jgi:hypothetical protein
MKRIALGVLLAVIGTMGANAQSFGVYVGTDHPYYRDHYYYRHHHHWRGAYAYEPECRVVVRTHINRWGHRVTIRRRICD